MDMHLLICRSPIDSDRRRSCNGQVPGDGRELVATDPAAYKIRAEDGRRVEGVDISPFINGLPAGRSTTDFSTDDASGSTSQAANIQVQRARIRVTTAAVQAARCANCFHMIAPTLQWRQAAVTYHNY
jgi:Predicted ATPase of the ABC class